MGAMQPTTVVEPPVDAPVKPKMPYFVRTLRWAAVIALVMTVATGIALPFLQPVIPLFYSLSQPEKQLAPKTWLILLPALAWIVTVTHFMIIRKLESLEGNIEKIFSWTTLGLVGLLGLLFIRIIFLTI